MLRVTIPTGTGADFRGTEPFPLRAPAGPPSPLERIVPVAAGSIGFLLLPVAILIFER
jgi:hypothetical protein